MNILDEIETSAPTAVVVISVVAVLFLVAVLLIIFLNAAEDAAHKRWLSKKGILPESQQGKSGTRYFVPILVLIVTIALGLLIGSKVGGVISGDSPKSSTVQTEEPER